MVCLLLSIGGPGLASGDTRPEAEDWSRTLHEIDALFEKFAADNHAPGLVYGVVRDGKLFHVHAIGAQDVKSNAPVTADTVFRIASLTKSFTALAVLKLRDDGRLDLDARVGSIVPEFKALGVDGTPDTAIRVRHLLAHTAGFVTDDPWGDRLLDMSEPAFSDYLRGGVPLARRTGEDFDYSNTGYAVLGRVISNVSGQPYQEYIAKVLLQPLGMTSATWRVRDVPDHKRAVGYSWVDDHFEEQPSLGDGAYGAMGGLSTSATDYARFVAWLLAAWQPKPPAVAGSVAPASVRETGQAAALSRVGQRENGPDAKPCPVAWLYGAGFYVVSDCELGTMLRHPGGLPGYGSQVLLLPDADLGIFAFANLTYAHLWEPVVDAAVRLKRAKLLEETKPTPSPSLLQAAAGAARIYETGDVAAAQDLLAPNLLLDIPAERRNELIRRDGQRLGPCTSVTPAEILHALGGRFTMTCEHGSMDVTLLLSPTVPARIQYLEFEPKPASAVP
jgi:CubicO group peptidase (beta-lactamase class C family)